MCEFSHVHKPQHCFHLHICSVTFACPVSLSVEVVVSLPLQWTLNWALLFIVLYWMLATASVSTWLVQPTAECWSQWVYVLTCRSSKAVIPQLGVVVPHGVVHQTGLWGCVWQKRMGIMARKGRRHSKERCDSDCAYVFQLLLKKRLEITHLFK